MQEIQHIVLNNSILSDSCMLRPGQISTDAVSESEDVLVLIVLQCVFIHIYQAVRIAKTRVSNHSLWFAWRIDVAIEKCLLEDLACVDIAEDRNLLMGVVFLDLDHFPAKADINTALVALIQGNLVGVREPVDLLVGCVVLDSGAVRGCLLQLIHPEVALVVKCVEVSALSFVWEVGGVADEIASSVHPAIPVVLVESLLVVEPVQEDAFAVFAVRVVAQTFDSIQVVFKASCKHKGFV